MVHAVSDVRDLIRQNEDGPEQHGEEEDESLLVKVAASPPNALKSHWPGLVEVQFWGERVCVRDRYILCME